MFEIGVVVDLDDEDAVIGFLEIDAVEPVADRAGGAQAGVEHERRHLSQGERFETASSGLPPVSCLTICQCFLAIRYCTANSGLPPSTPMRQSNWSACKPGRSSTSESGSQAPASFQLFHRATLETPRENDESGTFSTIGKPS
jgi:hypothetical protein